MMPLTIWASLSSLKDWNLR